MTQQKRSFMAKKRSRLIRSQKPAAERPAWDHDEWLIDESVEETFPASDPTLPSHPGSSLGARYNVSEARRDRTPKRS